MMTKAAFNSFACSVMNEMDNKIVYIKRRIKSNLSFKLEKIKKLIYKRTLKIVATVKTTQQHREEQ
ncbi:CLUMA_CG013277, isoform A [Clunio marinus]|uniref:CLUMA_CG013277, isoform A n=1 Tax=Clunio marinus TaxID=568069 RepID=A0A1J1IND1_9DIPT|nr:CLUMA_CG013277, isoform A [Clunio marinus]